MHDPPDIMKAFVKQAFPIDETKVNACRVDASMRRDGLSVPRQRFSVPNGDH